MNQKVLIIDDDPDILESIKLLLDMSGYTAIISTDGKDAISYINRFHPDLVILDIMLSGMDGRLIAKRIKANPKTKDIPVILISAHDSGTHVIQEYGVDDFIPKPFDAYNLLKKVGTHVSH
jgi:DNA-binding response OmpR family regulator